MQRSRLLLLVIALGVVACSPNSGSGPTTPADQRTTGNAGAEITLAPGMTVDVADVNMRVRFDKVNQDSRCPTNALVLCVWEGSAQVQLQVSRLTSADSPMPVLLETAGSRDTTTVYGQPLKLVRVEPGKVTLDPIPADSYRAVIRVGIAR